MDKQGEEFQVEYGRRLSISTAEEAIAHEGEPRRYWKKDERK